MSMEHGANAHEDEAQGYPKTLRFPDGTTREVKSFDEEMEVKRDHQENNR